MVQARRKRRKPISIFSLSCCGVAVAFSLDRNGGEMRPERCERLVDGGVGRGPADPNRLNRRLDPEMLANPGATAKRFDELELRVERPLLHEVAAIVGEGDVERHDV